MNFRRFFLVIILYLISLCCFADDCSDTMSEAKDYYNKANYQTAKELFEYVKRECGEDYGYATNWIKKCEEALSGTRNSSAASNTNNQEGIIERTPIELNIAKQYIEFAAEGGTEQVLIESTGYYIQYVSVDWLEINNDQNILQIFAKENTTTSVREYSIVLKTTDGKVSKQIKVRQKGKIVAQRKDPNIERIIGGMQAESTLSVSSTKYFLSAEGGELTIKVESNTTWELFDTYSLWYKVYKGTDETITIKYEPNTNNVKRTDYFNIQTTDKSKSIKIEVSQDFVHTLSVDRPTIYCTSNESTEVVKVNCNTQWKVSYNSNPDMVTFAWQSKQLIIHIKKNKSIEARKCTIKIRTFEGEKEEKIIIDQSGRPNTPTHNLIMLNGGFTTLPDYSYGLTYAWVKRAGFYFSAMSNFKFRFNSDYVGDSSGSVNGTYPLYSGKKEYTKITATTGLMIRFCEPLYMYLGGGYGYRGMYYETVGNEWVAIQGNHCIYHGGVGEIGLIGNIYGFSLSLGLSVITDLHNYYPEAKVGIGYCF